MCFTNQIRHKAAVVGNTLLKTFPEVLHHSPGQIRRNWVDFLLDPFLQILQRSRTMFENLFLQVSPKEKSHGLQSGDRAGHSTCPVKEIKRPGNNNNSPDVHRSKPLWVLTTIEANQPHDTTPTSLPPLQPSQCPFEKLEIFMPHSVYS